MVTAAKWAGQRLDIETVETVRSLDGLGGIVSGDFDSHRFIW